MEFVKAMEIKGRICEQTSCVGCNLNMKVGVSCSQFMTLYPQEAEKILIEWDKKHPVKTNLEEFCEHFGIVKEDISMSSCPFKCIKRKYSICEFNDFWGKEYKK